MSQSIIDVDFWKRMIQQHEGESKKRNKPKEGWNHSGALLYVTRFIETRKPSTVNDVLSWMIWSHVALCRDGVLRIYYDVLDSTAYGATAAREFFKVFIEYSDGLKAGKPDKVWLSDLRSELEGICATTDELGIFLLLYKYALCVMQGERLDYEQLVGVIDESYGGTEKYWLFMISACLIRSKELSELGLGRPMETDEDLCDGSPWLAYMEAAEYAVKWFAFCQLYGTGDDDFIVKYAARTVFEIQLNAQKKFPKENLMNLDTAPFFEGIRDKYHVRP